MNILSIFQSEEPLVAIIAVLYRVPAILIALTLHELAHGYVALRCGDPTAQMLGRLSFNPIRHLDPVGTLFMLLFGFGWARPVPVNSLNFRNFRRDDLLVSIAGVTVNFVLFFFTTLLMVGLNQLIFKPELWKLSFQLTNQKDFLSFSGINFYSIFTGENILFTQFEGEMVYYIPELFQSFLRTPWLLYVQRFLMNFAMINLGLCIFNLLPVPPLDGYHVVNDIFLRGKLHIPQSVMNVLMIVLLIGMYRFNFLNDFFNNVIFAVQNGVLSGILWIFGLG